MRKMDFRNFTYEEDGKTRAMSKDDLKKEIISLSYYNEDLQKKIKKQYRDYKIGAIFYSVISAIAIVALWKVLF